MKQDSYEYWRKQLEQDEARLKELEEKRIGALSQYDIHLSYVRLEQVVEEAKRFKRNHIKYDEERIAEFEAKGIQPSLL